MRLTARTGTILSLAMLAGGTLAGCAGQRSPLGALNVFGSSSERRIEAARAADRGLVDQVVSLDIAQTRSGAIVSAVGLPQTQGFWDAALVRVPSGDPSVLLLDFRLLPPVTPEPQGPPPSREVLTGLTLSAQDLAGIRAIMVQAARNGRTIARR